MEIVSGIVGAVATAILAFPGAFFLWKLQQSRRELSYHFLSASIIMPRLKEPTEDVQVKVRASLLRADGSPEEHVPVMDDIIGYRIKLRNSGNQVIENQSVTFTFDHDARIISIQPENAPDMGDATISTQVQHPSSNIASTTIPFLNPRQSIVFNIQSVGDPETSCSVSAAAPGLSFVSAFRRDRIRIPVYSALLIALLAGPSGILYRLLVSGRIGHHYEGAISDYWAAALIASIVIASLGVLVPLSAREQRPGQDSDSLLSYPIIRFHSDSRNRSR